MLINSLSKTTVRKCLRTVLFLILSFFYIHNAFAEEKTKPKDPLATINMEDAKFSEGYEDLKDFLNAADFDPNKVHHVGSPNAPFTLWDISSYSCSHCANFHKNTLPELYNKYIETGQLRIVFLNIAFDELTMYVTASAYATQNMEQFLAYTNTVYKDQNKWYSSNYEAELNKIFTNTNISQEHLNQTLQSETITKKLPHLFDYIQNVLQVSGTPHFILSKTGDSPEQPLGSVQGNDRQSLLELLAKNIKISQ